MKLRYSTRLAFSLFVTTAVAGVLSAPAFAEPVGWNASDWELEDSEFEPESGWHFGRLENGLRYIVRRNDRPENTALVRMDIAAGSLDERSEERGYAHYVEHMAFNGSTNVPEGEVIKLLERLGLAFGADTNASTSFDYTQYKLDLPRADEELLDTALMLMRETASELDFDEAAVQREKGVILAERRVRNGYALKNTVDSLEFAYPGALIGERLPIGTAEMLEAADAAALRAFWEREYVPSDTVIVVVGDFDPALVEAKITEHFGSWRAAPSPEQPAAGPIDPDYRGTTDIYLDPALTETITLARHDAYVDRPDTRAERRAALLRQVATGALSRRLQRLQRSEDPPFRGVSFSTSDLFEAGRTTSLGVASEEGRWREALDVAVEEYRRALAHGFSEGEIAEQLANIRTGLENAVANAATRSNAALAGQALAVARGDFVPTAPADALARFETVAAEATPAEVLAALRAESIALDEPLIRFSGKTAPEGGEAALRTAVEAAFARPVAPPQDMAAAEFAYTDFGTAGEVVEDSRTAALDIRTIRFANGVMLNLKPTDLADDRVTVRFNIDGGQMLASRADPLAVELTGLYTAGGLGRHSRDELQSILAGRSVGAGFGAGDETFAGGATTTPRDLELQLQLMAAYLTDPGYRAEGLGPWQRSLADFFARLGRTPESALGEGLGPLLSDQDPRFTRQPLEAYRALDYEQLSATIGERLANGAIEIALVGDFDEEEAIRMVAQTFGALPPREPAFRAYEGESRERSFTERRETVTLTHGGEPDQALLRMVWPTADDSDWARTSRLTLLARVMRLALTEKLREELGQTYSPSVDSSPSDIYRDYGTFSLGASVDVAQLDAAQAAMEDTVRTMIADGPDTDLVERARQPVLEGLENRLKTNGGWMGLVARAQSEPENIDRFLAARDRQLAITPEQLRSLAAEYLDPAQAVRIRVVPEAGAGE
ncbi:insulinase family protein [Qipengyuania sp. DY56-A-20]|uniref:Insulinase family protein n=1 Tax=Qipengyuania benthica TaxID=3067651 RepID=A0ABT9H6R7_9SPHN|nr:M16 family metallopeptidase [Qipengyuania sp. DY56-A-20]MDP4539011.1 insulinase family protein [Qipengyuania sp. DY56-A-20]